MERIPGPTSRLFSSSCLALFTAQKKKFSIKDFISKCDQIHNGLTHFKNLAANAGIIDRFCSLIWISFINALISFINRTKSSLSIFGSIFLSKQWLLLVLFHLGLHLANIHLFKVSNRNVEKDLKLVQRLKKMTSERRHCGCSVVFCWLLLKSPWKVIL